MQHAAVVRQRRRAMCVAAASRADGGAAQATLPHRVPAKVGQRPGECVHVMNESCMTIDGVIPPRHPNTHVCAAPAPSLSLFLSLSLSVSLSHTPPTNRHDTNSPGKPQRGHGVPREACGLGRVAFSVLLDSQGQLGRASVVCRRVDNVVDPLEDRDEVARHAGDRLRVLCVACREFFHKVAEVAVRTPLHAGRLLRDLLVGSLKQLARVRMKLCACASA